MIKSIAPSGRYIVTSGGSTTTYVNSYSGLQGVGNMRYNTSSQNIEIYDGNNWIIYNAGHVSVGLTGEAESLLDWARKKRDDEIFLTNLSKTNPTIKDLVDQIKQKEEQIEMVMILMKDEVKV